ncbi:hypothetical protein [Flammeovirga agarivorans]|uniref:Uncharacterized protein n=1 Tax=Flammeovirga agarivorans TaxID=2726742 RepID=A0A7X8SP39_9BACT|nr:hypothetical protein [Flammeovirga agarivorans]NLR93759.1 hypothetical protein [Flammeovirga agarivorans]
MQQEQKISNKAKFIWIIIGIPLWIVIGIYSGYEAKNEHRKYRLINYYSHFNYEVKVSYYNRGFYDVVTTTNDSIYFVLSIDYLKIKKGDILIKEENTNNIEIITKENEYNLELKYVPRNSYLHELKNEEEHLNKYGEVEEKR